MKSITGILLAGGLSRRYGSPKAFAKIHHIYFYEKTYRLLQSICDKVVIVTRKEFIDWFPEHYHVIVDVEAYQGCGPLAGIYSGMIALEADTYIVLPCDMPLLQHETIQILREAHHSNVTIAEIEGKWQPLVSIWSHHMVTHMEMALKKGQYTLKHLLKEFEVTKVASGRLTNDPATFLNINTIEEDEEMRKWLKS